MESLNTAQSFRYARLFKIVREDSTEFHFTSHDHEIDYDGDTYTPAGGHSTSNLRAEAGMKSKSAEFLGVLTSSEITDEDIDMGRYDNAEITEFMVDFMFPWAGTFYSEIYYISDIAKDGEIWVAQIRSKMARLKRKVGSVFSKRCRHRFGEAYGETGVVGCKVNSEEEGVTQFSTVAVNKVDALYPKSVFWILKSSISGSMTDAWFNSGKITGDGSGDNNEGIVREIGNITIEAFSVPLVRVEVSVAFFKDIEVGDTFMFTRGCDKLNSTCHDEYDNIINFGGWYHIPSRKKALFTPDNHG
jgi:uncharacterized phage protein (TIGR02218 family)